MYQIIVNPASRSGKGRKIWLDTVLPKLEASGKEFKVYFSEKAGDVAVLAKKICDENNGEELTFIILGGDGTVNEALQGMDLSKNPIIGYIPTGSSNDLARDLKLPKDPEKALDIILNTGKVTPMDLGMVTYDDDGEKRLFSVSAGIGFDAAVCAEAMNSKIKNTLNKVGLGKLTYLGIALKQILTAQKRSCTIELDNIKKITVPNFLFVSEHIHRYEGGGFMFAPGATGNDGMVHLCLVGDLSKGKVLRVLPTAFKGKHLKYDGIDEYAAKNVHITSSVPLYVHTDGEVTRKSNGFTVSCLEHAFNLYL